MKYTKHISRKWRKLITAFLLLSFIATPVLNAFPQEECSGTCEMMSQIHECSNNSNETIEPTNSCCNMMDINSTKTSNTPKKCEMEFSDIDCALVINNHINTAYIIPKTIDCKVDFVLLPMLNVEEDISTIVSTNYSLEISLDSSPPIYLMISSFLN